MVPDESETPEVVTESRVKELLEEALAPFKELLTPSSDEETHETEEESDDDDRVGSMSRRDLESFMEERMTAAMKVLAEKKAKSPTPAKRITPKTPVPETPAPKDDKGEEQEPRGPLDLKSRVQGLMGWK